MYVYVFYCHSYMMEGHLVLFKIVFRFKLLGFVENRFDADHAEVDHVSSKLHSLEDCVLRSNKSN